MKSRKVSGLPVGYHAWWYRGKNSSVHIVFPEQTLSFPIGTTGAMIKVPFKLSQLNLELK